MEKIRATAPLKKIQVYLPPSLHAVRALQAAFMHAPSSYSGKRGNFYANFPSFLPFFMPSPLAASVP
jgi:hypothetical protein